MGLSSTQKFSDLSGLTARILSRLILCLSLCYDRTVVKDTDRGKVGSGLSGINALYAKLGSSLCSLEEV